MTTFLLCSVAATCLLITTALVVDHIEVTRYNRLQNDPWLQQWRLVSEEERTFAAYLDKIGVPSDATNEQIMLAQKTYDNITKILKTM